MAMFLEMIAVYIFVLAVIFGVGSLFGYVVLGPMITATRRRKASFRFYTADFFSLTFVLALPAIYVSNFMAPSAPVEAVIVVGGLTFVIATWAWFRGATKLSSVGVSSSLKRFVFLAVVMPVALIGASTVVPFLFLLSMATASHPEPRRVTWLVGGFIVVPCLALAGRKICHWVVQKDGDLSTPDTSEREADLFSTANMELKNGSLPEGD